MNVSSMVPMVMVTVFFMVIYSLLIQAATPLIYYYGFAPDP
jgi:hypothetical protein